MGALPRHGTLVMIEKRHLTYVILGGALALGLAFAVGVSVGTRPEPPPEVVEKKPAKKARFPTKVIEVSAYSESELGVYPECLLALRCKGGLPEESGEYVVYLPIFAEGKLTSASHLKAGSKMGLFEFTKLEDAPKKVQDGQVIDTISNFEDTIYWATGWEAPG